MQKIIKALLITILCFSFFKSLTIFANFYLADIYINYSEDKLADGNLNLALEYANLAITLNPNEPAYYRQRARTYITLNLLPESDPLKTKALAYDDLKFAHDLNPNNLATLRNAVPLYYFLALDDLSLNSGVNNIDEDYVLIAKNYFNELKNKYPNDVGLISNVAKYEKRLGLSKEYEDSLKMVKELRPDLLDWYDGFK